MRYRFERTDRRTELFARLYVLDGCVEQPARGAERFGGEEYEWLVERDVVRNVDSRAGHVESGRGRLDHARWERNGFPQRDRSQRVTALLEYECGFDRRQLQPTG